MPTKTISASTLIACTVASIVCTGAAYAQSAAKSPTAQAFIDLATHASDMPDMRAMGAMGGFASPPRLISAQRLPSPSQPKSSIR